MKPWNMLQDEYTMWCSEWEKWRKIVGEATKGKTIKLVGVDENGNRLEEGGMVDNGKH